MTVLTDQIAVIKSWLIQGGIPASTIPEATIRYFLLEEKWPADRIVRELWGICPETVLTASLSRAKRVSQSRTAGLPSAASASQ